MRVKDAVRWITPMGLVEAQRRRQAVDLRPIRLLRDTSEAMLLDSRALERDVVPRLGLAGGTEYLPSELRPFCAKGLRTQQMPSQLAPYLVALAKLPIRSYVELGVSEGGSFIITVEYLRRLGQLESAMAVDIARMDAVRRYAATAPWVEVAQIASGTPDFDRLIAARQPDLVLIDGDHSLAAVRRDLASVVAHAKAIALHDIVDTFCPGVQQTWAAFCTEHADEWHFAEFTTQYRKVLEGFGGTLCGLGLAVRKDFTEPGRG